MQIKTEVKATINQIKQLIAEKYNIRQDFDLEIVDEIGVGDDKVQVGNFAGKQLYQPKNSPWYPDDSGEWVEVSDEWMRRPACLVITDEIEYLMKGERKRKNYIGNVDIVNVLDFCVDATESHRIVAYKKVK